MKCFFLLILGPFKVKIMTRKGLFDLMKRFSENYFVKRMDFLENYILSDPTFLDEENKYFKHKMSYIKSQLKKIWFASLKVENIFQKNNYNWQQSTIEIHVA